MLRNNIKFFREKRKISQIELARRAELSKSYVSKLEKQKSNPTLQTLTKIADALEICIARLIADNNCCTCPKCKETKTNE